MKTTEDEVNHLTEKVLPGKLISTRAFNRFTMAKIATTMWKDCPSIKVEKVYGNVNIFKFTFTKAANKTRIFYKRPWMFDGAHLVLEEGDLSKGLNQVIFDTSTFYLQVHGLSHNLLNKENVVLIGSQVGKVHPKSINKKTMVNHNYLRCRVNNRGKLYN